MCLAWAICVAGWVVVYTLPSQYQSSARLYAEADAVLGQTLRGIAVDGAPAQQVDLLARTLLSRPNLERVVARTDLDQRVQSASSREALIEALGRNIRITLQSRSLYAITYTDMNPQVAQAVVRTLLELFTERAATNDRQQMQNATSFVNQQLTSYETQLREAERRRAEFRSRYLDLLPSETRGGSSRLDAAHTQLADLRGELEDAQLRRTVLQQQLAALPTAPPPSPGGGGGGGGDGRVAAAERELSDLRLRYTDQHPAVIAQRNMIAGLRAQGGGGGGGVRSGGAAPAPRPTGPQPSAARDALQARIVDLDLSIASLERQIRGEVADIERLEGLARSAPQLQLEYANLDRDYGALRRQYEELLGRRESLQLAGAARAGADQVRLEIVEPPTAPNNPTGPNRLLFASGVLIAGLGAGAALAVLVGTLDRGFYSIRDLREIGLPVLGAISAVNPPSRAFSSIVFLVATSLLVGTYGLFLAKGSELVARGTQLVASFIT